MDTGPAALSSPGYIHLSEKVIFTWHIPCIYYMFFFLLNTDRVGDSGTNLPPHTRDNRSSTYKTMTSITNLHPHTKLWLPHTRLSHPIQTFLYAQGYGFRYESFFTCKAMTSGTNGPPHTTLLLPVQTFLHMQRYYFRYKPSSTYKASMWRWEDTWWSSRSWRPARRLRAIECGTWTKPLWVWFQRPPPGRVWLEQNRCEPGQREQNRCGLGQWE